jgi:TolB-like protein/Flp pilus assembly protein TadD
MNTSPDIFLSYNRDDQTVARRFAQAFQAAGFSVWWDVTLRSGEAYDEVTEKALRDAKAVVVLWSKKSVVSRWVRAEATLADRNRTLVPAMIELCERPIMFELTQTADLSRWQGDDTDTAWLLFLADVRRVVGVATGGAAPAAAPGPSAPITTPFRSQDQRPALAILPFTNRSGERADDVFADGMVEDLISALSLSGGFKVIAQSATLVYRRNVSDLRSIGQELDVRYLLEGNVRRVGSNLRVSAQLVEAGRGEILWTQKFDRPLTELADLQEDLVTEVARHLGVQVQGAEMARALAKPGDLTAWEAVMRSLSYLASTTRENVAFGMAEARKALAIAPDYALAHAMLGVWLSADYLLYRGGGDASIAREARAHAQRALALDAKDSMVLTLVGQTLGTCGSWREAGVHALRSLQLNPNIAITHFVIAQSSLWLNLPEEAIAHSAAALELAPKGPMTYQILGFKGLAHYLAGRYELALQFHEQAIQINPGFPFAWKDKAIVCEKLGRHEEARDAIRHLLALDTSMTLEEIEATNRGAFFPPQVVPDLNATLRKIWLEVMTETPTA